MSENDFWELFKSKHWRLISILWTKHPYLVIYRLITDLPRYKSKNKSTQTKRQTHKRAHMQIFWNSGKKTIIKAIYWCLIHSYPKHTFKRVRKRSPNITLNWHKIFDILLQVKAVYFMTHFSSYLYELHIEFCVRNMIETEKNNKKKTTFNWIDPSSIWIAFNMADGWCLFSYCSYLLG